MMKPAFYPLWAKSLIITVFLSLCVLVGFTGVTIFFSSNKTQLDNSPEVLFDVAQGESPRQIAQRLKQEDVIRSSTYFTFYAGITNKDQDIKAGRYQLHKNAGVKATLALLTSPSNADVLVRLTVPEGSSNKEIADIVSRELSHISSEDFLEATEGKEGFLFPDTYFVHPDITIDDTVILFEKNFEEKTKDLIPTEEPGRTKVIILASIIEEEGKTFEDRKIISGVLQNRLEVGMPLQVDAVFTKVDAAEGRNTYELTKEDLATDDPFNTYEYTGLPPAPITNPGLESIIAAIEPAETTYFYYVSEEDGTTHFAETLEEHNENVSMYLSTENHPQNTEI